MNDTANLNAVLENGDATTPPAEQPSAVKTASNGERDGRGRFTKGNRAACGNPHARRMATLRKAFEGVASEQRIAKLARKMYKAAVAGDWTAAKLFLSYAVGKPVEVVDPDRLALNELQLATELPSLERVAWAVLDSLAAEAGLLEMAREADPQMATTQLELNRLHHRILSGKGISRIGK